MCALLKPWQVRLGVRHRKKPKKIATDCSADLSVNFKRSREVDLNVGFQAAKQSITAICLSSQGRNCVGLVCEARLSCDKTKKNAQDCLSKKINLFLQVGFFPSECVELIGDRDKIPPSVTSAIPETPQKPVLRKRGQ